MFDPRYPWIAVGFLTLIATGVLFYYAAIVSGLYKDPLMGRFRQYGAERPVYPFCRFLSALGTWSLLFATLLDALTVRSLSSEVFAPAIFLMLAILAWIGSVIVQHRPDWREALPRWYFNLLRCATRQERRHIAFAWLRLPRAMRWRFNGDGQAFAVWTDTVRITAIYGARDPDDPWATWT